MKRKQKVTFSGHCFCRFFATEKRVFESRFFGCRIKIETEKQTRFFSVVLSFSCPRRPKTPIYLYENPVMDGHIDSFGTQQHSSSGSVRCCCCRGQTQHVYRLHSLQYYRQVLNLLMFQYWFPFMLRLSVTALPKMNSELTSLMRSMGLFFVFGVYYV